MQNTFLVNLNIDNSKYSKYLSTTLLDKIEENLEKKQKIILYLNKRGDYSSLICQDCSYLYKCKNCDLKMYVHKNPSSLVCHFCSYKENIPLKCKKCNGVNLLKIGFGTQQLETLISQIFPKAKIFRLDTDNVSNILEKKQALENIKSSDIIIGTKMITTGFDLENLGLIAIILLEAELSLPKYDVEEKTFINLKQLLGRGGRKGQITQNIIQTFIPNNFFVKQIFSGNYKDFFKETLKERKIFNYPPFCELYILQYKNFSKKNAYEYMQNLEKLLKDKTHPLSGTSLKKGRNNDNIEIIFNKTSFRRNKQYFYTIILKGKNLGDFLQKNIGEEILKNKDLNVIIEE